MIERVIEKRLTQAEAARVLSLTSRWVRRFRCAYELDGPGTVWRLSIAGRDPGEIASRRAPSSTSHGISLRHEVARRGSSRTVAGWI